MIKKDSFFGVGANWAMDAIESLGFKATGEYFKLNSYENRVYDLFLEPGTNELNNRLIIKVYRPGKWELNALVDEQTYMNDLHEAGVPVIKSLEVGGKSVFEHKDLFFTIFKKGIGRLPQELSLDQFTSVGRVLANTHNVGERKPAQNRKVLGAEDYGWPSLDLLADWIPSELRDRYFEASEAILDFLEEELPAHNCIRIHGDCHRGNLIANEGGAPPFFFIDFDDFCMGPEIQDFWMLLPGDVEDSKKELSALLKGYEEFRGSPEEQLYLIGPLRGLRIIHYTAWIARRWDDPTFPNLFPHFETHSYWAEETRALEKIASRLEN